MSSAISRCKNHPPPLSLGCVTGSKRHTLIRHAIATGVSSPDAVDDEHGRLLRYHLQTKQRCVTSLLYTYESTNTAVSLTLCLDAEANVRASFSFVHTSSSMWTLRFPAQQPSYDVPPALNGQQTAPQPYHCGASTCVMASRDFEGSGTTLQPPGVGHFRGSIGSFFLLPAISPHLFARGLPCLSRAGLL